MFSLLWICCIKFQLASGRNPSTFVVIYAQLVCWTHFR